MITVTQPIFLVTRNRRKLLRTELEPERPKLPPGRTPRISKLMALAIRFDKLLRDQRVIDLTELARLARVTQPRITQIMNLNHLAPDIQEELLHLPLMAGRHDTIHEKMLRPVCAEWRWSQQRLMWKSLRSSELSGTGNEDRMGT